MEQEVKERSITAQANALARKLELIIVIALTLPYISQGLKNSFSLGMIVALMVVLWLPVFISTYMYKQNPDSTIIKHVMGIGYGLFYLGVCFTSDQQMVFVYAFPMIVIVPIFCNLLFSKIVAGSVMVISVAHSFYYAMKGGFTPQAIASLEIEIAACVLVGVYCYVANKFIVRLNENNLNKVQESTKQTENMLNAVMTVSKDIANQIEVVSGQIEILGASSEETLMAMTEVQQGTSTTAESVQNQMMKTEDIQKQINKVSEAADNIGQNVSDSVAAITEGKTNIDGLIGQTESSERAGSSVIVEVQSLKEYTTQMESIVSMIQGVASKTSLLSLNASIEAARAGEAGRGFAVVASEISSLASQTKSATEKIGELITGVTAEMDQVANSVSSLVESNKSQNEAAHVTAESFEKIAENTKNITSNSNELSKAVKKLEGANKEIVDNIQTISAISEETSAHAEQMLVKTETNQNIVNEVENIVHGMTANAEKLGHIQ